MYQYFSKKNALVMLLLVSLFFFSCSNKNQKMCDCLIISEELNEFSNQLLMKEVNKQDLKKMKQLREDKKTKCADFQTMAGDKLLEMKKECAIK